MSTNKANNPMDIPGGHGPGQPPGGGGQRGPEQQPQNMVDQQVLNTLAGLVAQNLTQRRQREETGREEPDDAERQTQQRIGKLIDQSRALGFTLNEDEIGTIGRNIENATTQIESWLGQIEVNEQYYTSESVNATVEQKINVSLAWLYTLSPERHGVIKEQNTEATEEQRRDIDREYKEKVDEYRRKKNQLIEQATVRMDLHNIKKVISQGDPKLIGDFATKIGMHGLMNGFNIEYTQLAFNMYQRYFERHLYNYGILKANEEKGIKEIEGVFKDRISPQLISNEIRKGVREELIRNRELYGGKDFTEEKALIAERIGYSLFSASQRKGVHVSRGTIIKDSEFVTTNPRPDHPEDPEPTYHNWYKTPAFTSDPDELLANIYNPLEFQLRKWGRPSKAQEKVLETIMTFMGEGDLTAGEQKFIDSTALADLFTSGWRIEYILESIERRAAAYQLSGEGSESDEQLKSRVESIATGMRLKAGVSYKDKPDEALIQLTNVAKYRPLELLKAYVVEIDRYAHHYETKNPQTEKLRKKLRDMFTRGEFTSDRGRHRIEHYVELEEVLGRYIYPIYEKGMQGAIWNEAKGEFEARGWDRMRGIDLGIDINNEDTQTNRFRKEDIIIIKKVVEHVNNQINTSGDDRAKKQILTPDELINLYRKVQDFIGSAEAKTDIFNGRTLHHSQLFSRTLYLDDVPLDKLSQPDQLSPDKVDLGLAYKFNDVRGGGRDSYRRIWNDTSAGFEANLEFIKAINATKTEQLFEGLFKGSQTMSNYGGKEPALELAYNIAGGWLKLAIGDPTWRYLNLQDKLPIKTSELERLFGEGAASLSLEDAHHLVENLKLIFGDMTKDDPRITNAFHRAEKELGLKPWQVWTSRLYGIMFLLSLTAIGKLTEEIAEATKED